MTATMDLEKRSISAELALLRDVRCDLTEVSLTLPPDLPQETYVQITNALLRFGKSHQFWIGDALNYGERQWSRRYTQMLDLTGYERGTLYNLSSVCRRVDASRRSPALSFAHHEAVAMLEPEAQAEWLQIALNMGWGVSILREQVKVYREAEEKAEASELEDAPVPQAVVPQAMTPPPPPTSVSRSIASHEGDPRISTIVVLPPDLHSRLVEAAKNQNVSQSDIVRSALVLYFSGGE